MSLRDISLWQTRNAGKTFEWFGEDSLENFESNCKNPAKKSFLENSGWMSRSISYKFNSLGFRGREISSDQNNFCVFGDSITFGSGMPEDLLYINYISTALDMPFNNFGITGGSDSTSFRLAHAWIKKLRPKFVVWQKTFRHRLEWIENQNHAVIYGVNAMGGDRPPVSTDRFFENWIDSEANQMIMDEKNTMAMRWLCHSLDIPLIETRIEDFFSPEHDRARDLLHPGPQRHREMAEKLLKEIHKVI